MDASPPQLPPLHEIVTDPLLQTHQRYAKSAFILRSLLLLLLLPLLLIYRLRPSSYYYYYYYYHHHHNDHDHHHNDHGYNLWAIKLAAAFARHWVPFCRRFPSSITPRAPGTHFAKHKHVPDTHIAISSSDASGFAAEWTTMKAKYKELERRVTSMTQRYGDDRTKAEALKQMLADVMMDSAGNGEGYMARLKRSVLSESSWAAVDYDSRQHHAYCEVLIDKSEAEDEEGLPCLVYMSREKSLQHKHQYKAGNMNALIRVSGIFTNAPFILNLDCDTYATDGEALLQAMCFFMDSAINPQLGFVQFPQRFEGMDATNSFVASFEVLFKGWDGAQGPPYGGTSCVHKREVLYGKTPDGICVNSLESNDLGPSAQFISCAARILSTNPSDDGKNHGILQGDTFVEEAIELLGCGYENGTKWGKEIGLLYGAVTEDALTGLKLHGRGWKSVLCSPKDAAFLGGLPTTFEEMLKTRKRWSTGLLELMVGSNSFFSFTGLPKLGLIHRLNYFCLSNSVAVAIPLATYALLPCTSLLMGRPLFPKMEENPMWFLLGLAAFVAAYGCTYVECRILAGVSLQAWWIGEKMEALAATSSCLFGAYDVLKKLMGISDIKFEVTPKDKLMKEEDMTKTKTKTKQEEEEEEAEVIGGLVVNSKLKLLVPPTVIVMLNLAALSQFLLSSLLSPSLWSTSSSAMPRVHAVGEVVMKVEAWCCVWVLLLLHPIVKGLFLWCSGHRRSPLALHSSIVFLSSSCSFIALCILNLMMAKF